MVNERVPGAGPGDFGATIYNYTVDDVQWLQAYTVEPVAPDRVAERLADGGVLATLDLPTYLGEPLTVEIETGTVLYRLVQLFGTPNVPGLAAGDDQPPRHRRTWQYLLRARYDPADVPDGIEVPGADAGVADADDDGTGRDDADDADPPDGAGGRGEREWLLSVYDEKTNVSVGLSSWEPAGWADGQLPEPGGAVPGSLAVPDGHLLVGLVKLVLLTVEEPVQATYKDLWV